MIVPMKKYSFLVYHKEYESFLKDIQDLGVLHVIEKPLEELDNESLRAKYNLITRIDNASKVIDKYEVESTNSQEDRDGIQILDELEAILQNQEENTHNKSLINKELNQLEPWGDFSWNSIDRLAQNGIFIRFFQAPQRKYEDELKENYHVEEINMVNGHSYFILVQQGQDKVDIDAEELILPRHSISGLQKQLSEISKIDNKSDEVLKNFASKNKDALLNTKKNINADLAFDKVKLFTRKEAEAKLMILEGWTPTDKIEHLDTYLNNSGVYYEVSTPDKEDLPPIKLKNNRFAKLYEAIGELYTFPTYGELDLTPFFAPFYMLFFGFCLGDAGYGLLITFATIIGLFKAPPKFKPLLKLGMYLGLATIIMGILGGTFFGIMLHPENFEESGKTFGPFISKYQHYILSSDNLMIISLAIGYIQVVFGMFINAANRSRMYGFKYAISQLGWNIIVLVTLPAYALGMFDIIPTSTANMIALVSAIIGGIPAFFYNSPGKNPFLNFGTGLWEAYQVASGLLGDVLSYIRLFALGLSSAILGNVFNQLALQTSQGVDSKILGVLFMIIILAFGHSLNFFMAALGSFVHPLRLTFVEFYKNAGFMGGGRKYEPFSK